MLSINHAMLNCIQCHALKSRWDIFGVFLDTEIKRSISSDNALLSWEHSLEVYHNKMIVIIPFCFSNVFKKKIHFFPPLLIFPLVQINIWIHLISLQNSFVNNHELFKEYSKLQFLYQHLNVLLLHWLYKPIFVCIQTTKKKVTQYRSTV